MKRILFSTFITSFLLYFNGFAQSLDYSSPLPESQDFRKGVLPNGLTYYIQTTDIVKDAASYYIIQNVGSILENDGQEGLAHFLEHMAFNGTESFPGKSILNTLQKHGAVFGKDINAYTAYDETVYNLSNIPIKDGLVNTCLTVLRDWSNYLLLTEEEIDAERGVIKEEWRTRQSGQMRVYKTTLPIRYNYSKYADRWPIGLMSVVENFEYKTLRDFYHDWYRTDLQAIAVIGDVNVDEIEQKIIDKFSKIKAIDNPKERIIVDIPDNDELLYSIGMDPEVSTTGISLGIRHKKSLETETVADLKRKLLESMATSIINSRIREQAQKPEVPFLNGSVSYSTLGRTSNVLSITVSPKQNEQEEAFKAVLTEVLRAVNFGYLPSEMNRIITGYKSSYENQIAQLDNRSHSQIKSGFQSNFLENQTISDIEKEYEIAQKIFDAITPQEVHQTIKRLYSDKNRFINVAGVESEDNLSLDDAKQLINSLENDKSITPYAEALGGKTLISGLDIEAGSIKSINVNNDIGATTFALSNGVKVNYKFVDKQKDVVSMSAVSYGGTSLLENDYLPSAAVLTNLISMSGLGDYSRTDLSKVLAGKTANVSVNLSEINEFISGSSNNKDVETMLQLLHLYFVKPRFDEQAFQVLNTNLDSYLIQRSKNLQEQMKDSLTVTLYGENNPKDRIFNADYVSDISLEKIKTIYNQRFSDAADFEFFIIGDIEEDKLKPLLEKYVASISTKQIKENYKDNGSEWVSKNINKDIYIPMENPKASVNVTYKKDIPYSIENEIYTNVLGDILQLRVIETVRESEGGSYSPRAGTRFSREPKSQASIVFRFDCNPDIADKLVAIVNAEIQKIANGTISDEDLHKIKTNFIKEREQLKDNNSYDMQLLRNFFRFDYNMSDPKNFENIVNSISKDDIQDITKQILDGSESYEIIFKPKQ